MNARYLLTIVLSILALAAPSWAADRYTDNGDGTVTDGSTGLVWLKDADCFKRPMSWADAMCEVVSLEHGACGLEDGSHQGLWRLPTKSEWEATIKQAVANGCLGEYGSGPVVTDDAGTGCYASGSLFVGVLTDHAYWASTWWQQDPTYKDNVCFGGGCMTSGTDVESHFNASRENHYVWPVRDAN